MSSSGLRQGCGCVSTPQLCMELWGEGLRRGDKPGLGFAGDPHPTAWPHPGHRQHLGRSKPGPLFLLLSLYPCPTPAYGRTCLLQLNFVKRKSGLGQVSHPTSFSSSYFSFTPKHICGKDITLMMHRASLTDLSKALPHPADGWEHWWRGRSRGDLFPPCPQGSRAQRLEGKSSGDGAGGDAAAPGKGCGEGSAGEKALPRHGASQGQAGHGAGGLSPPQHGRITARFCHPPVPALRGDARGGDRRSGCRHRAWGHRAGGQQSPDLPTPRDALPILTLHSPPQPLAGGN